MILQYLQNVSQQDDIKNYREYIEQVSDEINQKRRTLDDYELTRIHRKNN